MRTKIGALLVAARSKIYGPREYARARAPVSLAPARLDHDNTGFGIASAKVMILFTVIVGVSPRYGLSYRDRAEGIRAASNGRADCVKSC